MIKADGLAAGKGVIVCSELEDANQAIIELLDGKFGVASQEILVEERITGPEMSAFALLDGEAALWLASAQDHKRAFDGDKGPNTGGMGAVSPSPLKLTNCVNKLCAPSLHLLPKAWPQKVCLIAVCSMPD